MGRPLSLLILSVTLPCQSMIALQEAEYVFCVHADGNVRVEKVDSLCCGAPSQGEDPCSLPGSCPDDDCSDLPLTTVSHQCAFDGPGGAPALAPAAPFAAETPVAADDDPLPPRLVEATNVDTRSREPSRQHLRTIILRL